MEKRNIQFEGLQKSSYWSARRDSNPQALAGTRTLIWRVCQFHHEPLNGVVTCLLMPPNRHLNPLLVGLEHPRFSYSKAVILTFSYIKQTPSALVPRVEHKFIKPTKLVKGFGRRCGTRTRSLSLPKRAVYQIGVIPDLIDRLLRTCHLSGRHLYFI